MTTELRSTVEREVGAGGEEVIEIEKGVRVRKSGGVEFSSPLSQMEIESKHSELNSQIEHQKLLITRAREESLNATKQANEQEILAREALEFKEFNRNRQKEAASEACALMIEVTALIEKEKALERERAAVHHAAVLKERERVEAKTAEVMAREEAIEAEKREMYHKELVRNCQAQTLKFKLEEEQAKLKLESLQYSLQYGEFRGPSSATKAKIIVEVEPRNLPEARQFDTAQVERIVAAAEMQEEPLLIQPETRTVEEIVSTERGSSKQHYHSSSAAHIYSSRRGSLKGEAYQSGGFGQGSEVESRLGASEFARGEAPPVPPLPPTSKDIKVLPELKPREAHTPESASYRGGGDAGFQHAAEQVSSPTSSASGTSSSDFPHTAASSSTTTSQLGSQSKQAVGQGSTSGGGGGGVGGGGVGGGEGISTSVPEESARAAGKKQKPGFFKKFISKTSHEQPQPQQH